MKAAAAAAFLYEPVLRIAWLREADFRMRNCKLAAQRCEPLRILDALNRFGRISIKFEVSRQFGNQLRPVFEAAAVNNACRVAALREAKQRIDEIRRFEAMFHCIDRNVRGSKCAGIEVIEKIEDEGTKARALRRGGEGSPRRRDDQDKGLIRRVHAPA